jgi:ATP-binding cassette subfamily F protein 3
VFSGLNLELPRGSRTAVVGINGAGKTTLLRIISGEDSSFDGTISFGSGIKVGYFSQDQESALNSDLTVLQEASLGNDEGEARLRSLLGAFLFSGDDIQKKVGVLSGGERNRLALLKILLDPVNLLILDEPTNHLDIHSKDVLLDALMDFGGTLVIVSHDRYFLEKIADRVLELDNGVGTMFLGDYAYYRWRRREGSSIDPDDSSREGKSPVQITAAGPADNALSREEQKKRRTLINRLRKEEESLTVRLEEKERKASELKLELERPENYSDPDKAYTLSAELMQVEERIEQITAAWEEAATALEKAESEL